MKINIVDKDVKHVLDLSNEELVRLIKFEPPSKESRILEIISPILVFAGPKKFQVKLVNVESSSRSVSEGYESLWGLSPTSKGSYKTLFTAYGEVDPEMVRPIIESDNLLVLSRIKNVPSYAVVDRFKIYYDRKCDKDTDGKVILELRVSKVKPIEDLLKSQITEEQFYEVYVVGRSDEFFRRSGDKLDDLIGLIGLRRREGEDDYALRRRVVKYLRKVIEEPPIPDEEINKILRLAEIDRKIDEAKGRRKR
jgi:hypothetical protein